MSDSRKESPVIDFAGLEKTNSRIKDVKVQELIKKMIDQIKEAKTLFDEKDINQNDYYLKVNELTTIFEKNIEEVVEDSWSEVLAKNIIERFREYIAQFELPDLEEIELKKVAQDCFTLAEQQSWLTDKNTCEHFEKALTKIMEKTKDKHKSVYISHAFTTTGCTTDVTNEELNWIIPFLTTLSRHLRKIGFQVSMLPDYNDWTPPITYMQKISETKYVLLIGSPMLLKKHNQGVCTIATTELNLIRRRYQLKNSINQDHGVFSLIINSNQKRSLPIEFELYKATHNWVPSLTSRTYFQHFRDLLNTLLRKDLNGIWNEFLGCDITLITQEAGKEIEKDILDKAIKNCTPILIKKDDTFYIYGKPKDDERWEFTKIDSKKNDLLFRLPFRNGIIERGDPLFNQQLINILISGHALLNPEMSISPEKRALLTSPPIKNAVVSTKEVKSTTQNKINTDVNSEILIKINNLQEGQAKLLNIAQQDAKQLQESTQIILNKIDEAKAAILSKVDEIDSIAYTHEREHLFA